VTRVRLETDVRGLVLSPVAGGALAAIFAGLPATGIVIDFAAVDGTFSPWNLLWIVPSLIAGGGFALRATARRAAWHARADHAGVFEAICELAERHRVGPKVPAVRVEDPAAANGDDDEDDSRGVPRAGARPTPRE
jgi:hypothetical protein